MSEKIQISQNVAILIDGNNIERSLETEYGADSRMVNFDVLVPRLLGHRGLNRLIYFREGQNISSRLADKLHSEFYGSAHSSLGYLTPAAFAAKIRNAAPADVTERTAAAHGAFAIHSVTSEDKPEATRADLSS